jgi:hypothetical protein
MESEAETVETVLARLDDNGECGPLFRVATGETHPDCLDYEDWVKPVKLSGGRVAIKEETTAGNTMYYWMEDSSTLHAAPVGGVVKASADRAVLWLRDGISSDSRLIPVLREDTPFGKGDDE